MTNFEQIKLNKIKYLQSWVEITEEVKKALSELGLTDVDNYIEMRYPHRIFSNLTPEELLKVMKEYRVRFKCFDALTKDYGFVHEEGFMVRNKENLSTLIFHSRAKVFDWYHSKFQKGRATNKEILDMYIDEFFRDSKSSLERFPTTFSKLERQDLMKMKIL